VADDGHAGARVVEQVFTIGRFQQSIHWDGHGSNLDGPEKTGGKRGSVLQEQKDAFLWAHAQPSKPVAHPVYEFKELAIADEVIAALDSHFLSPAFGDVAVHKILSGVELIG
jgi:hypothetical protein